MRMRLKVSSAKLRSFCLGLNVLNNPIHWDTVVRKTHGVMNDVSKIALSARKYYIYLLLITSHYL